MSYTPTEWHTGDIVSSEKLNKLENGVAACATEDELNDLETAFNDSLDSNFVTFDTTLGSIHQSTLILPVDISAGADFILKICSTFVDTTHEQSVKAYYSDNTEESIGSIPYNSKRKYTASKDIIGFGFYVGGAVPTGKVTVIQYLAESTLDLADSVNNLSDSIDSLSDDLEELATDVGGYINKQETVPLEITTGYYINGNGVITSTAGNYKIGEASITAGETYFISASSNWSNPLWAWYNDEDELISKGTDSESGSSVTSVTDVEAKAPTGATKIVINYITSGTSCELKYSQKKIAGKWYGKKWACVGDSLTAINQYTTKHYFDFIADISDIQPINMGDSGTGYKRGEDSDGAFYQRISSIDTTVDVVTIFGSFNDIGAGYTLGTYTDTETTTIAGCINTTIDNLQTAIPTVILGIVAPTPWETARPDFHTSADDYVNMLKKIAEHRSIPYLDLFRCSNLRPWDSDFRTLAYSNDGGSGVHPNDLGHQIIAPKFEAFLDSLLLH